MIWRERQQRLRGGSGQAVSGASILDALNGMPALMHLFLALLIAPLDEWHYAAAEVVALLMLVLGHLDHEAF
jgi:hypothetical protein